MIKSIREDMLKKIILYHGDKRIPRLAEESCMELALAISKCNRHTNHDDYLEKRELLLEKLALNTLYLEALLKINQVDISDINENLENVLNKKIKKINTIFSQP